MPAIDADQILRLEFVGRLFQYFAHGACGQGLVRFPVPGGLIEHQALRGMFFHQQEFAVLFKDGGNGGVWFPDHDGILNEIKKAGLPLPFSDAAILLGSCFSFLCFGFLCFLCFFSWPSLLSWQQELQQLQKKLQQEQELQQQELHQQQQRRK